MAVRSIIREESCRGCRRTGVEFPSICQDCWHENRGAADVLRWIFKHCRVTATVRKGLDKVVQLEIKQLDDVLPLMDPKAAMTRKP